MPASTILRAAASPAEILVPDRNDLDQGVNGRTGGGVAALAGTAGAGGRRK